MGPLKAYVLNLNTQMNATPQMNKFAQKFIFQVGFRVGGGCLVQVSKTFEDMAKIIKIFESIKIDGSAKK